MRRLPGWCWPPRQRPHVIARWGLGAGGRSLTRCGPGLVAAPPGGGLDTGRRGGRLGLRAVALAVAGGAGAVAGLARASAAAGGLAAVGGGQQRQGGPGGGRGAPGGREDGGQDRDQQPEADRVVGDVRHFCPLSWGTAVLRARWYLRRRGAVKLGDLRFRRNLRHTWVAAMGRIGLAGHGSRVRAWGRPGGRGAGLALLADCPRRCCVAGRHHAAPWVWPEPWLAVRPPRPAIASRHRAKAATRVVRRGGGAWLRARAGGPRSRPVPPTPRPGIVGGTSRLQRTRSRRRAPCSHRDGVLDYCRWSG